MFRLTFKKADASSSKLENIERPSTTTVKEANQSRMILRRSRKYSLVNLMHSRFWLRYATERASHAPILRFYKLTAKHRNDVFWYQKTAEAKEDLRVFC